MTSSGGTAAGGAGVIGQGRSVSCGVTVGIPRSEALDAARFGRHRGIDAGVNRGHRRRLGGRGKTNWLMEGFWRRAP